jgi:membrane fusion protein, copper/silver efflux system
MRTPAKVLIGIILAAGIFLAGYAANRQPAPAPSSASTRHAASYTCPMHPQYTSDRPGDCPICGMRLEPVSAAGKPDSASEVPGTVAVGTARQQLIGVRTDEVRRDSSRHALRVPARIAVDDQRLFRIVAAVDGWILDLNENTTGRFVKKDQLLATYYTRDLLSNERLFLLSVPANDPLQTQTRDFSQASIRTAGSANPQFPIDALRGLGMSDLQIEEIHKTRTAAPHVKIYSPVSGFVLARNVSPRQRFDKGTELYRIGDISRVWVMTDIFEKDRQFLKPGAEATILYQGRRLQARMSDALPQFDAQSRTLKTRFELENPGYLLQPDMFVEVELNVEMPPAITVPADAVFDSGLRKTVFVDRGQGNFEPRRVETGWRLGDRVQVVKGLMEGERVVAAANFLLDSESRMRAAAAGIFNPETDPVCGMEVDAKKAAAAARTAGHGGRTYYFCSDDCKKKFEAEPAKYTEGGGPNAAGGPAAPVPPGGKGGKTSAAMAATTTTGRAARDATVKDVVCGMDVDPKDPAVAARKAEFNGTAYYFCSDDCRDKFRKNPAAYVK